MTAITTRSIDVQSCSLSINGVDVSDNVIKVTFPSSWINNDVTAFGSVGRRYNAGIDETKFTVEMMFNQVATTGSHTVVGAVHTAKTTVPFVFYPATTGTGNLAISGNISIPKYDITSQVGSIVKVTAECWVDNGITWGTASTNYTFTSTTSDGYVEGAETVYATAHGDASGYALYDTQNLIYVGQTLVLTYYEIMRGFLYFNTSALAGKTITAAYLNLNIVPASLTNDFNFVVMNGQTTYPHDPLQLSDYAIANYAGSGGTLDAASMTAGYNQLSLNATGQGWINKTGETKLAILSSRDIASSTPTGNEFMSFYSSNMGTGYQPQLVVTIA